MKGNDNDMKIEKREEINKMEIEDSMEEEYNPLGQIGSEEYDPFNLEKATERQ
jgi:hypothetical protein